MPITATADNPGYFREHPDPEFHVQPRTVTRCLRFSAVRSAASSDAQVERTRATSPNRSMAARRAASGVIPLATYSADSLFDVELQLLVDLTLRVARHGRSVDATARLTARESRAQPCTCSPSSRSPAFVSR